MPTGSQVSMELPPWTPLLAVVLTTLVFLSIISRRSRRAHRLPPGPKPWPIIGNLNLMGALPHRSMHALSQRYGPLMYLRFGSSPVVVGSSAEMARFFLKSHDVAFIDRPRTAAGKYTAYNHKNITWSPYGAYWRQARRMCLTELFSAKRLESYEYIRNEEMLALVHDLHEASGTGRAVVLKDHLSSLSLNVITRMVLGKKYQHKEEFTWMIQEWFVLNGALNIGDYIPWLNWMDLQGYIKRMKKLGEMFDPFLEHVVEEHGGRRRLEGESFVAKDMVDLLLEIASDPDLEVPMDRDGVKAFIQELITAGTESSAETVEWAMSEILKKPEVLGKATEELDRVVGRGRWVSEKDVPSLPYVEAIVKETMRLHPVGPTLSPRLSREEASVGGYHIPIGTRVMVNVWSIGRDPALWDAPEEFAPERFLLGSCSGIDVKGQDYGLLPFGSGRRMCPAYSLGLKLIQVSLANLLHGFAWRLPDGVTKEELSMEEIFGLSTPRRFPLEAVVGSRLPDHLYAMA